MQVRRLTPDDWSTFRDIRLRSLADAPEAFGATFADESALSDADWQVRMAAPDRAVFVAERAGDPVGEDPVGVATGGPAPDYPNTGALYGMWVAPSARGQGLGEALIEAVKGWAIEAGYPALGLGVTTTNAPAIALYERAGFTDTGERWPLREGTGLSIQFMVLPLT